MEQADFDRLTAHYERELRANTERYGALCFPKDDGIRGQLGGIAERPELLAVLSMIAGASIFGALVWALGL